MDKPVERIDPDVEPRAREPAVVRPSRARRIAVPLLLLVAGLAAGLYWWTRPATPPVGRGAGRTMQMPPQPVGAATIDRGDIRVVLNELGTVTPLATVTVKTQINGQLVDVGFQEGQVVRKGDFLAQIDPRPYLVTLEQAQGQLAHDQGLLQQAQTDLKRYQTLGRQDSIAQQQVDDQRFLVAQYTGSVQSDQAQVDSSKLNLTYCHIISPIDGQVGLRQVDPGNYVQTTDANGVVVITQMQPISVIFTVPEDNLPEIIQQVRGGTTLSVEAYDRANTRKLATGELATLDNQIDTTTGTLKLRATFANPDEMLYPNQFVNARLLVNTLKDAVRVPVPAVQRGEPGTFVYVINADNTVSVRAVKLGPTDGNYQAVLAGLQPGDVVVTDGTDRLRDGAAVIVPGRGAGRPRQGEPRQGQQVQGQPEQSQPEQSQPGAGQAQVPEHGPAGQPPGPTGSRRDGHGGTRPPLSAP